MNKASSLLCGVLAELDPDSPDLLVVHRFLKDPAHNDALPTAAVKARISGSLLGTFGQEVSFVADGHAGIADDTHFEHATVLVDGTPHNCRIEPPLTLRAATALGLDVVPVIAEPSRFVPSTLLAS